MRELRKSNDRKLMGVAAGLADYFEMDRTLCRVMWAVGSIFLPPLVLAYLILGLVLPSAPYDGQIIYTAPPTQQTYTAPEPPPAAPPRPVKRLTKSRDRWLAGVAAGLAEYLDLDPVLVRLLFLASLFAGGMGLLVYLILAAVMPRPDYQYQYQAR